MKLEPVTVNVTYHVKYSVSGGESITSVMDVKVTNDGEFTTNDKTDLMVPQSREEFNATIAVAKTEAGNRWIVGNKVNACII